MIGNDIVDLQLSEARGKAAAPRFVERVCTTRERDVINSAIDPDRALWSLWAAKEVAFKAARRARPDLAWSPRSFEVSGDDVDGVVGTAEGIVRHPGVPDCRVRWFRSTPFVHCVGVLEGVQPGAWGVKTAVARGDLLMTHRSPEDNLSAAESASVRKPESSAVRLLGRLLCSEHRLPRVEIIRPPSGAVWGPPAIYAAGRPLSEATISLSHDGRWVAAALLLH